MAAPTKGAEAWINVFVFILNVATPFLYKKQARILISSSPASALFQLLELPQRLEV